MTERKTLEGDEEIQKSVGFVCVVKKREREREGGEDLISFALCKQGPGQGLVDADWWVPGGSCVHTLLGEI